MKLIARKVCNFGGKKFYIGEEIPAELVLDPLMQEKREVLAIVPDDAGTTPPADDEVTYNEVDTMTVVIRAKEGDLPLNLTKEGLQSVVDVLSGKPGDADEVIAQMNDGDALILLHIVDSRKAVKQAAESRAKALNEETENPEEPENPEDPEESAGDQ